MLLTWVIVFIAAGLWIMASIYRRSGLLGVEYSRYFSEKAVFEGEQIEMVEVIANRRLLPLLWLRLESILPSKLTFKKEQDLDIRSGELSQNHISLFSLLSYRRIVRRHQAVCNGRGVYRLESVTMTTGDPFGLVSIYKQIPLSEELIVYPAPLEKNDLPLPNHSWLGELLVRRWLMADPFMKSGVREYFPGDSLGSVHWLATARSGKLQVHKQDYTADHKLMICLNLEVNESMWKAVTEKERIELGIRYAATAAAYASQHGLAFGLLCNGWVDPQTKEPVRLEPKAGSLQLQTVLEMLARLELSISGSMSALLDKELLIAVSQTDYLLISCHQSEQLAVNAGRLAEAGHGIEWMMIPEQGGGRTA